MKGVNKCVVEIVEPQDESIERVLVFFKPESRAVQLGCQQDAAEKYVSGLVSWRRSILPLGPGARAALWAAAATPAACAAARVPGTRGCAGAHGFENIETRKTASSAVLSRPLRGVVL